jgi:Domain of unknown function (DUF4166)
MLYSQLMGAVWADLDERVRWAHSAGDLKLGLFRIKHGTGSFARWMARRSSLPRESRAAETCLRIVADDAGERWERSFNGSTFVSQQRAAGGMLLERIGVLEFRFFLRVEEGALVYEQRAARLCAGRARLPMPRFCSPRVQAREWADSDSRVIVAVKVTLPIIGLLIEYRGHLMVTATP